MYSIKTITRLEGATPWPSFCAVLVAAEWRWGPLPPARLVAVRRAPRRLPRARPHCGGCARGICGLLRARRPLRGGPPLWRSAPPGCGPPPGPWGRGAPLRRVPRLRWPWPVGACARPSLGSAPPPGGCCARWWARPPPVRPGACPGPLSAPSAPWSFVAPCRSGSPRAARRLRRRLRPRSSALGALRGSRPAPRPPAQLLTRHLTTSFPLLELPI